MLILTDGGLSLRDFLIDFGLSLKPKYFKFRNLFIIHRKIIDFLDFQFLIIVLLNTRQTAVLTFHQ